jgi:hypothetical protein
MTNKNLTILAAAAVILGGAAYFCNSGRKIKTSNINGRPVLQAFDVSEVQKVEIRAIGIFLCSLRKKGG